MSDRKEALIELLEKVGAGAFDAPPGDETIPHFNKFMDIAEEALPLGVTGVCALAWRAYRNHSIDAAKALHEAVLPGWHFDIATEANGGGFYAAIIPKEWGECYISCSENPARAWLVAIIKALISQEKVIE